MRFDYKLWYDCETQGTGEHCHMLRNKMCIYRGWYQTACMCGGWTPDLRVKFTDAEKVLRKELHEMRMQRAKFSDFSLA